MLLSSITPFLPKYPLLNVAAKEEHNHMFEQNLSNIKSF